MKNNKLQSDTERVRASVEREFDNFKATTLAKPVEEIFLDNYEIHVKTELKEVILSYDFGEDCFRVLNKDARNDSLLQALYEDFISVELASVNTGQDVTEFVEDYCEKYHSLKNCGAVDNE